jgi:F0F1-type ATP synthase membrane subunit c/vacuolar-type H+-ATPase subunit K
VFLYRFIYAETHVSFVKILVIEIFSSVLGLFGLIIGLLVSSKAHEFGQKSN